MLDKLKKFYTEHEYAITNGVLIVAGVACLVGGGVILAQNKRIEEMKVTHVTGCVENGNFFARIFFKDGCWQEWQWDLTSGNIGAALAALDQTKTA